MRSTSLVRSSAASRISVSPSAWLASTAMTGNSSMQRTVKDPAIVTPCNCAPCTSISATGSTPPAGSTSLDDHPSAPIISSTSRIPVLPRVDADAGAAHRPPRARRDQGEEERGRADVAGDPESERLDRARMHRHLGALGLDADATHAQHPLGVIASGQGFDDGRRGIGGEPREQDRRLHLRACDGRLPRHARQRALPAANPKRRRPGRTRSTSAPMARSGSTTRAIGRRRSDASPSSVASQSLPASTPARRRMVVPELPQSSHASGVSQADADAGSVERVPVRWEVTHPDAARAQAAAVARTSSAGDAFPM